jgi:hypothetical protein
MATQEFSAARGSGTVARLEVNAGAARLELRADPSLPELFRARFVGRAPAVRAGAGSVTLTYAGFSASDWQMHAGMVALNVSMPWEIQMHGGVSSLTAELALLKLRSFQVRGGASDVAVSLPRPQGTASIALEGGVSRLALHRPSGVAVRLRVSGGVSTLAFDAERLEGVRGEAVVESSDYATAPARYEITVSGGAAQLTVRGGMGRPRFRLDGRDPSRRDG